MLLERILTLTLALDEASGTLYVLSNVTFPPEMCDQI